ncbi:PREDICTED: nitrilase homolog 1 [Colobus angolensis palliatus]|uniref:nitrilase homolog 1 n=1 Tax=Colobus angolensis palliatus TaxID=336983 RepID=UPI0005F476E7|nr:PREDICTED: nitrilase homolog 1 [Colobus angolensis palliatus]
MVLAISSCRTYSLSRRPQLGFITRPPHRFLSLLCARLRIPRLSVPCAQPRPRAMAISSSSCELPLVAVCQVTSTPDKQQNFKTCAELVREAARLGACLAFLPEAFDFIARDPAETLRLSEPLGGRLLEEYTRLARYQGKSCFSFQVGLAVCYDMRFPELSLALAQAGAEILTYPSAFGSVTGPAHWEVLLRARAIETQCYVVAAAQCGRHHEKRASYGHSMVVDPWGTVVARCSEGPGLCLARIDLSYVRQLRQHLPVFQHRRPDLYGNLGHPLS